MEGTVGYVPTLDEVKATGSNIIKWNCTLAVGEELSSVSTGHSLMGRGYFIIQKNRKEELAMQALRIKQLFKVGC